VAQPRWLDRDQQRAWRAFLRATHLLDAALDAQLQRDAGLPLGHYMVLAMLSEAPGRSMRMTELAAATQSSRSRLSHAVARLEARGLVVRRRCPTDGRGYMAVLTADGLDAVVCSAPGHVDRVRAALFDLLSSDEVAELERISDRVAEVLEAEVVSRGEHRNRPVPGS
jgi:DNA-binding MarR family transcriptional regulator